MMPKLPKTTRRRSSETFRLETLEPRLLFSADAVTVLSGVALDTAEPHVSNVTALDQGSFVSAKQSAQQSVLATPAAEDRLELIIIDRSVTDAEWIADQLKSDTANHRIFAFLDTDRDGLDQITEILAQYESIVTVHLFSHGKDAELLLGNTQVDQQTLLVRAAQVSGWGSRLTNDADLLIYGCDLAASDAGREYATLLGQLLGVDVAASENTTGAAAQGGDWTLEYQVGRIESGSNMELQALNDYSGTLNTYTVSNLNDFGTGSFRDAIQSAMNVNGPHLIQFTIAGTIELESALPGISKEIVIDGSTAPGYSPAGLPVVILDGTNAGAATGIAFEVGGDFSEIKSLGIVNFEQSGIYSGSAGYLTFLNNYIGNDSSSKQGNLHSGFHIENSADNKIGDGTVAGRNYISGNTRYGVGIYGAGSTGNIVNGNYIGWTSNGSAVGNGREGISIQGGASDNKVIANIISNNASHGVHITGSGTTGNTLKVTL